MQTRVLETVNEFCFSLLAFLMFMTCFNAWVNPSPPPQKLKVLVASPIRQKPAILKEFLASLDRLEQKSYTLDYFFIDDNDLPESRALLQIYALEKAGRCSILTAYKSDKDQQFVCDETTHHWTEDLVWRVAGFRDRIIAQARNKNYDHLLLIDSDIVLHPRTVEQLISTGKDIISNVFWTRWYPHAPLLPNLVTWIE